MLALILIGVFDGLSSIIRNTVRQLQTPDAMRGRMMSITQIFFKGGPQLGEVESGLVAQILGVPFAIISGGVGCVLATWIVVKKIPQLWNYNGDEAVKGEIVADLPTLRMTNDTFFERILAILLILLYYIQMKVEFQNYKF